jgi:hypothetical protein
VLAAEDAYEQCRDLVEDVDDFARSFALDILGGCSVRRHVLLGVYGNANRIQSLLSMDPFQSPQLFRTLDNNNRVVTSRSGLPRAT